LAYGRRERPDTGTTRRGRRLRRPYWTGYELLRNSLNEWTVAFSRVDLRFLRIRPALGARTWDLDEIDLLE
jgi:hypothetical protein